MQAVTRQFILGGHAVFTVAGPNGHYTYKVRRPTPEHPYFASLLTGPNNTTDYTYLGVVGDADLRVHTTRRSAWPNDAVPVRVLAWALAHVEQARPFPAGYTLHHEGRCARCGRALTTPESVERGFGPECWATMN